MAMDVQLPDGTLVQNIPEGTTQAQLTQKLAANGYDVSKLGQSVPTAPQQPAQSSYLGDIAKSFGTGLASLPAGVWNEFTNTLAKDKIAQTPTDTAISGAVSNLHQPQTIPGQIAETAGQFLPAAFGGEGALGARALNVALPTAGAETAGLLTSGGKLQGQNPYARALGSFVGVVPALWGAAANATSAGKPLLDAAKASGDPEGVLRALQTNGAPIPDVTYTAAQATNEPNITALESQSRAAQAPSWNLNDRAQNQGLVNALQSVVSPYTDAAVQQMRDFRDAVTAPLREDAYDAAQTTDVAAPVQRAANNMASANNAVPGIQNVRNYVVNSLPGDGPTTANDVYTVRKTLADSLRASNFQNNSELTNSVKSARSAATGLISSIDDTLNGASNGLWGKYLTNYQQMSPDINNAEALNAMRSDLMDKIAGGAQTESGVPKLTRAYITSVISKYGDTPFGGPAYSPGTAADLSNVSQTAQGMEAPIYGLRAAQTGGMGSNTAANLVLGKLLGPVAPVVKAVGSVINSGNASKLASALQNHQLAAQMLQNELERRATTSAAFSNLAGNSPVAATQVIGAQQ